jgi:hypothetical protein
VFTLLGHAFREEMDQHSQVRKRAFDYFRLKTAICPDKLRTNRRKLRGTKRDLVAEPAAISRAKV